MRCACPMCGDFMPQAENGAPGCICPGCLYRVPPVWVRPGLISREKLRRRWPWLGSPQMARETKIQEPNGKMTDLFSFP